MSVNFSQTGTQTGDGRRTVAIHLKAVPIQRYWLRLLEHIQINAIIIKKIIVIVFQHKYKAYLFIDNYVKQIINPQNRL